jgi:lipid A ethanolaminephosphotransferase
MKLLTAQTRLILVVAAFLMATGNLSLYRHLLDIYPLAANLGFLAALTIFFTAATACFLLWICHGRLGKWLLALIVLTSAFAGFYMDQYGIVIDQVMVDNIMETNPQEAAGLLSAGMLLRVGLLGLLPAWLVLRFGKPVAWRTELKSKLVVGMALLAVCVLAVLPVTAQFASFVRAHKIVRMYQNPLGYTWSLISYTRDRFKPAAPSVLEKAVTDAHRLDEGQHSELIVLVVGETARADRFSLNGYARDTNPELAKRGVVSFTDVSSCGTSTGESLPCMFSVLGRKHYDRDKAMRYENVLDVLASNGVAVLWRDNNSDSKGVATRMTYEDFKSPKTNPACEDGECRDIGMLSGLDAYIDAHPGQDILVVLHQMGNHGPEYYKRYPKAFERYTPVCRTAELNQCSKQELDNAYDNAILYTDYFLANVIDFLKKYDTRYATAMLYVSDHGESLGERGVYLHSAPYMIAPAEQTHVPAVLWTGARFDYSVASILPYRDRPLSHDDLFCSLLVGFEIGSEHCAGLRKVLEHNPELKSGRR